MKLPNGPVYLLFSGCANSQHWYIPELFFIEFVWRELIWSSTTSIDVKEAIEKHKSKSAIFIDVRDSSDIKKTGTILDGLEIPRGLIEFVADEATPLYNNNLKKDSEIILICGVGGQAALTGKTLIEMGYKNCLLYTSDAADES